MAEVAKIQRLFEQVKAASAAGQPHDAAAWHELEHALIRALEERVLGATGVFSLARISKSPTGDLRVGVGIRSGRVVLSFPKPVPWISMDRAAAIETADAIRQKAEEAR